MFIKEDLSINELGIKDHPFRTEITPYTVKGIIANTIIEKEYVNFFFNINKKDMKKIRIKLS
jgi:hypothetical protein